MMQQTSTVGNYSIRGFTLLEILLVMVIIGSIISVAQFSVGDNHNRLLRNEAKRLDYLIKTLSDEAIAASNEYGLKFTPSSYLFLHFDNTKEQWVHHKDRIYEQHNIPKEISFSLHIENRSISMPQINQIPDIIFFSSGEVTPFELNFILDNQTHATIRNDGFSTTKMRFNDDN